MGAIKSKLSEERIKEEIEQLQFETNFTADEIKQLYKHFASISSSINEDGVIDVMEFQQALGFKDKNMAKRIFRIFDENNDQVITFREFVVGLSILCKKGSEEEKLKLSFKIYDVDGDGYIDKEELFGMLKATLFETLMLNLSDQQMRALVDSTFTEVDLNGDGKISFEEYKLMAKKHPAILDNMTIRDDIISSI